MNRSLAQLTRTKHGACWARLVVSAACSGCYSFNHLLYKEWVTDDDKDCSIIPIKLKGYREKKKSYRNKYYFVIIAYIICCFNNKEDYFIIINFHVYLQAACVLDQKSLEISGRRGRGVIWGFVRLTAKPRYLLLLHRGKKKSHTVTALAWRAIGSSRSNALKHDKLKPKNWFYYNSVLIIILYIYDSPNHCY